MSVKYLILAVYLVESVKYNSIFGKLANGIEEVNSNLVDFSQYLDG